jgi:hypothetical protein
MTELIQKLKNLSNQIKIEEDVSETFLDKEIIRFEKWNFTDESICNDLQETINDLKDEINELNEELKLGKMKKTNADIITSDKDWINEYTKALELCK